MKPSFKSIFIRFDTHDFWSGQGWYEDDYIDRISTDASERNFHTLVAGKIAALYKCTVEWDTKSSGTGDDIEVEYMQTEESRDAWQIELEVKDSLVEVISQVFQDYKDWVIEDGE